MITRDKKLRKYILKEDKYLNNYDGIYIFNQDYDIEDIFRIIDNQVVIRNRLLCY